MMPLSIMVITGATSAPAAPADNASTPTRSPSFDVFQSRFVISEKSFFAIVESLFELEIGRLGSGNFGFGIVAGIDDLIPGITGASASATAVLCDTTSFAGALKALVFSSPIAAFCGD
jgi:hypothetical protein